MTEVTRILSAIEQGDPNSAAALLPLVYDELRKLALQRLAHEKPGQTLQATALVHEAYLRLVGNEPAHHFNSRGHFVAAASQAMRRILVESARHKKTRRQGGDIARRACALEQIFAPDPREDLLALDEALDKLVTHNPEAATLVQLRYFAGLTLAEAADALNLSPRSAGRLWAFARAWLRREVEGGGTRPA
jgi:RNA polymerase sigma factor (TIGR02999 family)